MSKAHWKRSADLEARYGVSRGCPATMTPEEAAAWDEREGKGENPGQHPPPAEPSTMSPERRLADLSAAVREFFTYLDATEDSELSGREFHPVTLGCCRAMWVEPLGKVIMEMKRLSAEPPVSK